MYFFQITIFVTTYNSLDVNKSFQWSVPFVIFATILSSMIIITAIVTEKKGLKIRV